MIPIRLLRGLRGRLARAARELRVRAGQPRRAPLVTVHHGAPRPTGPEGFVGAAAWTHLTQQCAHGPRVPGTPGHARTRDWLVERLVACADEVALQRWTQRIYRGPGAGRVEMTNLFARIQGLEPGDPLMLAAHWDTRPVADQDPDPALRGEPVPGANDGASGVAVLLEAARALAVSRPRRTVLVGLFDGEDLGEYYYGSRLFARWMGRAEARRWRPARAIVVDMVGKRGLRCALEQQSLRAAPALCAEIAANAAALELDAYFGGPTLSINDDHTSLIRAGVPAALLIDYAYPEWHTTHDLPDRCDPASLEAVGRVLVALARGGG